MTDFGQHVFTIAPSYFPGLFPGFIFSLAPRLTVDACAVGLNAYWSSHCRLSIISEKGMWLLRSVIWVSLFAPGLWSAIWVSFFHSRSVVRVTFQSLGMSVFWVKNESVWSVMTTCNGM